MILRPSQRIYRPPEGPFEVNRASSQARGLIAWWPPARHPGTRYGVPDMAGNLPATMVGSVEYVYDPIMGWALDYVADSNKYLSAGVSQTLTPSDAMTVSVWFNADVVTGDTKLVDHDSQWSRGWWLSVNNTKITIGADGGSTVDQVGPVLSPGITYLVTATGNTTIGWRLYEDGLYVAGGAWRPPGIGTAPTLISRGSYNGYFGPFNGRIGDVRIYNRAMSDDEVWQLYDPATRWDLYQPTRRLWAVKVGDAVSPPDAPSDLTATATASDTIALAWTDNSADETGFRIERSLDGATWAVLDTAAADATSYDDDTCDANTRYYYRVCAYNAGGDSDYTSTANAKTPPDAATQHEKPLVLVAGQVEQSDGRYLALTDGVPEPDTVAGIIWVYVDQDDGDLKVKFGDGHTATLAADS